MPILSLSLDGPEASVILVTYELIVIFLKCVSFCIDITLNP